MNFLSILCYNPNTKIQLIKMKETIQEKIDNLNEQLNDLENHIEKHKSTIEQLNSEKDWIQKKIKRLKGEK